MNQQPISGWVGAGIHSNHPHCADSENLSPLQRPVPDSGSEKHPWRKHPEEKEEAEPRAVPLDTNGSVNLRQKKLEAGRRVRVTRASMTVQGRGSLASCS